MGALTDGVYPLHLGSRFTETFHAHYKILKCAIHTNSKSFQKRKMVATSTISLVRVNWPLTQSDNEFVPATSSYISNMDHTATELEYIKLN